MKTFVGWGVVVASIIFFFLFLYLLLNGDDTGKYVTVGVLFVFTILATRLEDITKVTLSATGLAADLREKLRETEATLAQLQHMAELFSRLIIGQIGSAGRIGGMNAAQQRDHLAQIESGLKEINVPAERVEEIMSAQDLYYNFDYYHWVTRCISNSQDERVKSAVAEFKNKYPDNGVGSQPTPAQVEDFLQENGWLKGELAERLSDWKHYSTTRSHRRFEEWEKRGTAQDIGDLESLTA